MADLVLKDLARRDQLVKLRAKADRYRQAGEPVPRDLQLLIALAQNRIPDPPVDKRDSVDPRVSGRNRGRRTPARSTVAKGSPQRDDQWTTRLEYVRHFNKLQEAKPTRPAPPIGPGTRWTKPIVKSSVAPSERVLARRRLRAWNDRERPASVSPADWALLRLVTVERLKVPAIAKLPAYYGIRAEAIRKRLQRARRAK